MTVRGRERKPLYSIKVDVLGDLHNMLSRDTWGLGFVYACAGQVKGDFRDLSCLNVRHGCRKAGVLYYRPQGKSAATLPKRQDMCSGYLNWMWGLADSALQDRERRSDETIKS